MMRLSPIAAVRAPAPATRISKAMRGPGNAPVAATAPAYSMGSENKVCSNLTKDAHVATLEEVELIDQQGVVRRVL